MFNDDVLERVFADKEMQKIPIGTQATAVSVFENVIEKIREEKPDAKLSELLSNE